MLVAGFACKDFSLLNNRRRNMDGSLVKANNQGPKENVTMANVERPKTRDVKTTKSVQLPAVNDQIEANPSAQDDQMRGTSGDTFVAVLDYAAKYRPLIVILENVCSAPWDTIKTEWEIIQYAAEFIKLDTKDYYLPHTRQRYYMICIDTHDREAGEAENAVKRWSEFVKKFARQASSSVDEFLFDDENLYFRRAMDEMTRNSFGNRKTEVKWAACQARHTGIRKEYHFGIEKPITHWYPGGNSTMLEFGNHTWMKNQVDRIKDTIDITHLNAALLNYDPAYKPRYPDLSQNVDRHGTPRWGVTGCLTPSGIPYCTTRGGPITGAESLALQGIDVHQLIFTRETQQQLQDLAGNAMTSTVVGAAMLCALKVGYQFIPQSQVDMELAHDPVIHKDAFFLSPPQKISFGPQGNITSEEFHDLAMASAKYCGCEGSHRVCRAPIRECKRCMNTVCDNCVGSPLHDYPRGQEKILERRSPNTFRNTVKRVLPMLLRLDNGKDRKLWASFSKEYFDFRDLAERAVSDVYHYTTSRRSNFWTIRYDGLHSKLELNLASKVPRWYLYVKVRSDLPRNDRLRELAASPIARMDVLGQDFLSGSWYFCLPGPLTAQVLFNPAGSPVKSWKARLGLEDARDEKMWSHLTVKVVDAEDASLFGIDGTYEWLPVCGMACSSLYRRLQDDVGHVKRDQYLFLDPKPLCHPTEDKYVFASNHHRLLKGEIRDVDATVDTDLKSGKSWRPAPFDADFKSEKERPSNHIEIQKAVIKVTGRWIASSAVLEVMEYPSSHYQFLNQSAQLANLKPPTCTTTSVTFLSCALPVILAPASDRPSQQSYQLDEIADSDYLRSLSCFMERVTCMKRFSSKWRSLSGPLALCAKYCSPPKPSLKWRRDAKSNMVAYEDPGEATNYERVIKARPPPITMSILRKASSRPIFEINVNLPTLAHRACAKLASGVSAAVKVNWKLNCNFVQSRYPRPPSFVLKNNNDDSLRPYCFANTWDKEAKGPCELFPEQQRSLSWAINQESQDAKLFTEVETEESCVGALSWRVAVKISQGRLVRGGVFADQVGYGKTILALALIDSQRSQAEASVKDDVDGYIPVKATLVVTPALLVSQWESEIEKFLPPDYVVVTIQSQANLKRLSIEKIMAADIVLIGQNMFSNESYLSRLAFFSAIQKPPMNKAQSRYFKVWLDKAEEELKRHVELMKKDDFPEDFNGLLRDKLNKCLKDEGLTYRKETHYLSGQAYQKSKTEGKKPVEESRFQLDEVDRYKDSEFESVNDFREVEGPVLSMFRFHRLIMDEYTYVKPRTLDTIAQVTSQVRWVLSGTPSVDKVSSIASLAGIIGVNFGADYTTAGVSEGNEKADAQLTMAEEFYTYSTQYSADWQEEMEEQAQKFLDRFVRQNKPERSYVTIESYRVSKLHLVERAHYLELQTKLLTQDMQTSMTLASGSACESTNTLNEMLSSSDSPAEALLKRCTAFTVKRQSGIGFDACTEMVRRRRAVLTTLESDILEDLKEAVGLKKFCGTKDKHFERWVSAIKVDNKYGDSEICRGLSRILDSAEEEPVEPKTADINKAVKELRNKSNKLINMAQEYVDRFRRLRFVEILQEADISESIIPNCSHNVSKADLNIIISCGHTLCKHCSARLVNSERGICKVNGCDGIATSGHITQVGMLGGRLSNFSGKRHYGSKIQDLVVLVKKIRGDPEGEVTQVDSDGDSDGESSEVDSETKARQSNAAKRATRGKSGKKATRGESSKKASRGNSSKKATRGKSSKKASQGDLSKKATRGESNRKTSPGDLSRETTRAAAEEQLKDKKIAERIIVFVQFPDLMDELTNALLKHGITCAAISGKDDDATVNKEDKMILDFKKDNGKYEVLILNSAKDCAAGQ
jgi:SNF2 family DNA or RNA helicase/site-specific DNA-cytosine methylase